MKWEKSTSCFQRILPRASAFEMNARDTARRLPPSVTCHFLRGLMVKKKTSSSVMLLADDGMRMAVITAILRLRPLRRPAQPDWRHQQDRDFKTRCHSRLLCLSFFLSPPVLPFSLQPSVILLCTHAWHAPRLSFLLLVHLSMCILRLRGQRFTFSSTSSFLLYPPPMATLFALFSF